jgi:N utilization substance protein B
MNRKTARENAFILLFERSIKKDETAEEIFEKATVERGLEYDDYVKQVFFGSYESAGIIDERIEKHLKGWKKDRISPVSMAIIRLGCYEILFMSDIPSKVSINEAVELAKKYDDEKSYAFVNGVLNSVAVEIRENE